jgi:hypothetical protein
VLKIVESIATQNEMEIVKATIAALKALSDDDGRIVLFDENSQSDGNGSFQIAVCSEDSDGNIAIRMGAFHFSSTQDTTRFLWFTYSTSTSEIFTAKQAMTLNVREYAEHREKIQKKLGKFIDDYIDELPI